MTPSYIFVLEFDHTIKLRKIFVQHVSVHLLVVNVCVLIKCLKILPETFFLT